MIFRYIIKKNNIFFEPTLKRGEDTLFCEYIYAYSQENKTIKIRDNVYFYRMNPESVCHQNDLASRNSGIMDLITRTMISRNEVENICINDAKKRKVLRESQYLTVGSALFRLPESSLNYKEIMGILKEKKLYPYPFCNSHWKLHEGLKTKLREITRSFFRFEWIYRIYFNIKRKKFMKRNKE